MEKFEKGDYVRHIDPLINLQVGEMCVQQATDTQVECWYFYAKEATDKIGWFPREKLVLTNKG